MTATTGTHYFIYPFRRIDIKAAPVSTLWFSHDRGNRSTRALCWRCIALPVWLFLGIRHLASTL